MKFTAVYRKVPEGYIGFVEELPGANTQGKTLDEVRANIPEVIAMTLEANRMIAEESIAEIQDVVREPVFVQIEHVRSGQINPENTEKKNRRRIRDSQ